MLASRRWVVWVALLTPLVALNEVAAAFNSPPCQDERFEGSTFTVCHLDTHYQEVRLFWTDKRKFPLRSFAHLAAALHPDDAKVQFAFNAGMFDSNGAPIGLFVEDSLERIPVNLNSATGNFYLKPNGVFWTDKNGILGATPTERFVEQRRTAEWATQSGPMLVIGGALGPEISVDGPSKLIRNGVGVFDEHDAYFVISDGPVSFGRLARFFRDALKCPDALYLDGVVSSAWIPSARRRDASYPLGPMVVVSDR